MIGLQPQIKKLIKRLGVFLISFIFLSSLLGSWIIGNQLLYGFYFFIYPNIGKLGIFSVILFVLLTRGSLHKLHVERFKTYQYGYLGGTAILLGIFYFLKEQLLAQASFSTNLPLSLTTHLIFIALPISLLFGMFGIGFLKSFFQTYKKALGICFLLSVILYIAIFQIWKLWPYFSGIVLQAEYVIFSKLFDNVYMIPPRGLFVETFVVEIAEACSGLESIFLFTVLYIIIVILDWKKLILRRVIVLFPILLGALVFVNILRVFLLILIGVLINPQIMAALFHTYLGLILFIVFFLLFMKFGYPFIKRKSS